MKSQSCSNDGSDVDETDGRGGNTDKENSSPDNTSRISTELSKELAQQKIEERSGEVSGGH
jgi:hypothetical protein